MKMLSLFLILPGAALAAELPGAAIKAASEPSLFGQVGQMLFALLLVVGLILLLAWLVGKLRQIAPSGASPVIRIIASQGLGPKDRLVLVQVGEEQILLGLTPGRISPLHVLREPVVASNGTQAPPEFALRLKELLGAAGEAKEVKP